jgi:citrate lyase subunit beta/citryl-CoA lyase
VILRSWLFVPGDSERKLARAVDVKADALILDLEDSVLADRRDAARELVTEFINSGAAASDCWVRVNPLGSADVHADLRMLGNVTSCGVMLPKASGPAQVAKLRDALVGVWGADSSPRIVPIATETPAGVFAMGDYGRAQPAGLAGLTWGAEDLAAELGVLANRDSAGHWTAPFQLARSLCLMAARDAGVEPIDTLFADFTDTDGLRESCALARRDGFSGKLAIHPGQVAIINEQFTPGSDELDRAQRVVQAFADNPGAGVLNLDGKMVDRPHLLQAQRVLDLAARLEGR